MNNSGASRSKIMSNARYLRGHPSIHRNPVYQIFARIEIRDILDSRWVLFCPPPLIKRCGQTRCSADYDRRFLRDASMLMKLDKTGDL